MKITDLNPDIIGIVLNKRDLTRMKIRSGDDQTALDWTELFKSGPILLKGTRGPPKRVTSIRKFEGNDYLKDKVIRVVSRKKSGSYDMVVDIYDPLEPEFPERSKIRVNSSLVFFEAPRASASKKKRRSRKKANKAKKAKRTRVSSGLVRRRRKRTRRKQQGGVEELDLAHPYRNILHQHGVEDASLRALKAGLGPENPEKVVTGSPTVEDTLLTVCLACPVCSVGNLNIDLERKIEEDLARLWVRIWERFLRSFIVGQMIRYRYIEKLDSWTISYGGSSFVMTYDPKWHYDEHTEYPTTDGGFSEKLLEQIDGQNKSTSPDYMNIVVVVKNKIREGWIKIREAEEHHQSECLSLKGGSGCSLIHHSF